MEETRNETETHENSGRDEFIIPTYPVETKLPSTCSSRILLRQKSQEKHTK